MINKIYSEICYGCGACQSVCPRQAIEMRENGKGFLEPAIREEACIDCGLCQKVCRSKVSKRENIQTYIARLKDRDDLVKSQSGGAFVAISNVILQRGGVVYGSALDGKFEAHHVRAESGSERDSMRGSKYIQSRMEDAYVLVHDDLENGREVLFSGTPCQVAGLYRYLNQKRCVLERLYTVDLVCHGVPSVRVWRDLMAYYEKKENSAVCGVEFRSTAQIPRGGGGRISPHFILKKNKFLQICMARFFIRIWHCVIPATCVNMRAKNGWGISR